MKSKFKLLKAILFLLIFHRQTTYSQTTITVGSKPAQTFQGTGFNTLNYGDWDLWINSSESDKRYFMSKFITESKFTIVRPWPENDLKSKYFSNKLIPYMVDAGVKFVVITGGLNENDGVSNPCTNAFGRAAYYFSRIKSLVDAGYKVTHFDIRNKTNTRQFANCRMEPSDVINAITTARTLFDSNGLKDIGIIGPSTVEFFPKNHIDAAHVAAYDCKLGDDSLYYTAINNSPAAMAALKGFSMQDYGLGISTYMQNITLASGKESWVSLAATDDAGNNNANWMLPAISAAQYLSDVNHGATHFTHWSSGQFIQDGTPSNPIFQGRFYVFKALNEIFDVGSVFRISTSTPYLYSSDMQWKYLKEPDIISATTKNLDGSFGIGIVNLTGLNAEHRFLNYYSANEKTIVVTLNIPELANVPLLSLTVSRIRSGEQFITTSEPIVMINGKATISVTSMEIVALRSQIPSGLNNNIADNFKIYPIPSNVYLQLNLKVILLSA
ncbi:MAG: hypothetical protein GZ091_00530 [Paludibacter sp.]|nr:hypothetical protein [Paludibacter sp.]